MPSPHLVLSIDSHITVANLTALSAVIDGYVPNGSGYFISSLMTIFQLNKTATDTIDDITVVSTASGTGRWYRLDIPSEYWVHQLEWYIDSVTGADESSGLSWGTPIKTFAEFKRRIGSRIPGTVTVHIKGDNNFEFSELITTDFAIDGHLIIDGYKQEIYAGSVTSKQSWVPGTTELQITDSAIPTSWTASGLVGKLLKLTSGTHSGAGNYILKDLGSKTCRIPLLTINQNGYEPNVSDAFSVYDITKLTGWIQVQNGAGGWLTLQDIDLATDGNNSQLQILGGATETAHCRVSMAITQVVTGSATWQAAGCLFYAPTSGACIAAGDIDVFNCGITCPIEIYGGRVLLYSGCVFQGPGAKVSVATGGTIWLGCYVNGGTAVFDNIATSLEAINGGRIIIDGKVWGTNNITSNAIVIKSDSSMIIDGSYTPDILGSATSDCLIGGVQKTFAEVTAGYINLVNMARSVPST